MKLNVPEYHNIRQNWQPFNPPRGNGGNWPDTLKVYDRHDKQVRVTRWDLCWKDPQSSRMALMLEKAYWAKGRKMRIDSTHPDILAGEYVVTWKAEANSYDKDNFVVVEFATPVTQNPKQALAWLEQRMAELEALDGITTEEIIHDMKVR